MLSQLDRYLIREVVPYFLLSLVLLTAIIFAQEASRFSELIVVSSRSGLPMLVLSRVMTSLFPSIFVFTLPVSLLMGILVGLGRLSGDSEIVALGASGMSRWRILRPVVLLSLVVGSLMLYLTFNVLPRSVRLLTDLKRNQSLVFQGLNTEIKPRVFEESIPQKVLYIEDIDRARNLWHNIFLVDLSQEQTGMKVLTATSGSLRQGERSDMPELVLQNGAVHHINTVKSEASDSQDRRETAPESARGTSGDAKEKKRNRAEQTYTAQQFEELTIGLEVPDDKRADVAGVEREAREVEEMVWSDLVSYTPAEPEIREWRAEIHKRIALPAACLVFAMLGVTFGISNVRTGRSFGLILGLAITVAYYLLALWGQHAAVLGKTPEWLGIWLANAVLTAIGLAVTLRQRRPGSDPLSVLSSIRHAWPLKQWASVGLKDGVTTGDSAVSPRMIEIERELPAPSRKLHLPPLLDRLVLADLARFFLFILGGFATLFLIITLFQLLDPITRNNIDWTVVASYLFFLLPFVFNNVTPVAALVAVMVTFGILQKTSQVVALKASGQSIYRLAAPAVAGSLVLSGVLFFNQDYIMPFSNPRQNNLRYLIRKGQEPPQTFYQTTNQWIFGIDSRIFNYAHLDVKTNVFARLNVLDLSREPFGIMRRIYAKRAYWNESSQSWQLENGWERRFESNQGVAFEQFKEREYTFEETPSYFKKDSRGSSSLTMSELQNKINDLSHSGFDVVDLRIALQGKFAFPLTCMVMVLVGLPFSFSVGKRGALYGVAIGIAIGLAYWGLQGLFEQMGRYEVLPPVLAAWGPNMLFGAGGLYLFLHSRT